MNTQSTPVHIKLWHRGFWMMSIANFLVAMSVYIFLPVIPEWMAAEKSFTNVDTGISFFAFALGLFLLGPFCSYLVQRYRRNKICITSILSMAACASALFLFDKEANHSWVLWLFYLQRFLFGAFFGLAQMVLTSTLVIDTCESFLRTEANHSASWFSRLSLSIGPMVGLLLYHSLGFDSVVTVAIVTCVAACMLVASTKFPFRAPEEGLHHLSLDRFFLTRGTILFVNLLIINVSIGILFSLRLPFTFYGFLMGGFLLALLAQHFVFRTADLKSEVISALMFIMAAILLLLTHDLQSVIFIAPLFIGFGVGIVGARFLLFFIKLSRHCQRGTSQSTFMLAWESGIAIGLGIGFCLSAIGHTMLLVLSLILSAVALGIYHFYAHSWFMSHKNR